MEAVVARGRILWNSVYEPYGEKLHDKLSSYHPDFVCECVARFFAFRFIFFFACDCFWQIGVAPLSASALVPRFALGFSSRADGTGENHYSTFCPSLFLHSAICPCNFLRKDRNAIRVPCTSEVLAALTSFLARGFFFPTPSIPHVVTSWDCRITNGIIMRWSPASYPDTSPPFSGFQLSPPYARLIPHLRLPHLHSSIYHCAVLHDTVLSVRTDTLFYSIVIYRSGDPLLSFFSRSGFLIPLN